jgi:hypothetical protein
MTRDLIVRGFDDEVHADLGRIAKQKGVSINSIVKDAVDTWLKRKQEILKKHHLIIYSDDKAMLRLLKSIDRLADEADLFKSFCGAPSSPYAELLSKMKWYNGTIMPYYYSNNNQRQTPIQKEVMKYCGNVMANITNNANNKQLCCMDFLINDIAKTSLRQALDIEEAYDNNRLSGLMYCTYKTENLLNSEIKNIIELFEMHDQVFLLKEDEVYKLHVTKENVHKLFLN